MPQMQILQRCLEHRFEHGEKTQLKGSETSREQETYLVDKVGSEYSPPALNGRTSRGIRRRKAVLGAIYTLVGTMVAYMMVDVLIAPLTPVWIRQPACRWLLLTDCRMLMLESEYNNLIDAKTRPEDLFSDSRVVHEIPQYVLDYAPLVHLFSEEQFWPCDIAEHLSHITPELNYTPIEGRLQKTSNLTNLDELNMYEKGRHVFLTSNDNVEERPDWLGGQKNIPDEFDDNTRNCHSERCGIREESHGGRSDAPAVLIMVEKGHGIVDAFWFYFYSYNLGNIVFNIRWGNHVGDWEHTLIRFQHGKPKLVFFSEHNFGSAYSYNAVEKIGERPVVYSATGTHAMYATPGVHPYILPLGLLHDQTDRGPLWDPVLNSHTYTYNHVTDALYASNITPHAPTQWFYFAGHWGDKFYPLDDDRQYGLAGEYHYVNGPLGPRFKNLGRKKVCQGAYADPCVIKHWLDAEEDEVRVWPGVEEGEDWSEDEGMRPPGTRAEDDGSGWLTPK